MVESSPMTRENSAGYALLPLALAALCLAATCGEDESQGERAALERARSRWEAGSVADYRLTLSHDCFCAPEARGPVVVRVERGAVTSRTYRDTGLPVGAEHERLFPDVDGLFAFIEEALDQEPSMFRARYDPATGHPLEVWVDYSAGIADEERGYTVQALERS